MSYIKKVQKGLIIIWIALLKPQNKAIFYDWVVYVNLKVVKSWQNHFCSNDDAKICAASVLSNLVYTKSYFLNN